MSAPRLILASRSPRRAALLREWGYAFEQAQPPFTDPPQPQAVGRAGIADLAADLARRKALSLRDALRGGKSIGETVILAADTICIGADGSPLGQPRNRDDARAMLRSFIGQMHDVVTGVAVVGPHDAEATAFADTAAVNMGHIDANELNAYLDSDHWRDKAGGYNLFDRQAAGWPTTVTGDPTTVVGLPMRRLVDVLRKHGIERR